MLFSSTAVFFATHAITHQLRPFGLHHSGRLVGASVREGGLALWVEGPTGRGEALIHSDTSSFGTETAAGSSPVIVVNAGYPFGVRMGGGNLDAESRISGELVLSNFLFEGVDCNGVVGGTAVEDNCGTCDSNPANDCVRDCAGVWGGTASLDACGDCVGGTTGRDPCSPSTDTPTEPPITSGTDSGLPSTTPSTDRTASGTTLPATPRAVDGCGCASRPSMQVWGLFTRRR